VKQVIVFVLQSLSDASNIVLFKGLSEVHYCNDLLVIFVHLGFSGVSVVDA
jgi:hypothetical protein